MKNKSALFLIIILFILMGCPGINDDKDPNPTPTPDNRVYVIEPQVNLIDSSDYEVQSAYLGYSSTNSNYIYGIVKIKYTGETDLSFIQLDSDFKDDQEISLFTDFSYVSQNSSASTSVGNINTFFTPDYNLGYYRIIENLDDHDITLSDIAVIDIVIDPSSSDFTYAPPQGEVSLVGSPYRIESDSWYQNFENTSSDTSIEDLMLCFYYIDNLEREYFWSFPLEYIYNSISGTYDFLSYSDPLSPGDKGYSKHLYVTPDFLGNNFMDLKSVMIDWNLSAGASANVISTPGSSITRNRIMSAPHPDDLNSAVLEAMNQRASQLKMAIENL